MKYNFDRQVDRKQTNDLKWNADLVAGYFGVRPPENMIPMWLADTDFPCAPVIVKAIEERAKKEIFGYCAPAEPFYNAVCWWEKTRFNWEVDRKSILYLPSVVAGINIAVRTFSEPGDGVIIQPPVYDPFASIVKRDERKVVENQLLCDSNGRYTMNLPELETLAADPRNKVMILCSPHNPVGRVWMCATHLGWKGLPRLGPPRGRSGWNKSWLIWSKTPTLSWTLSITRFPVLLCVSRKEASSGTGRRKSPFCFGKKLYA